MNNVEQFQVELGYIQDDRIRKSAQYLVGQLPSYFFEIAASSTGKYHPSYSLGLGGLLRHTKAAVRVAHELLQDPVIGNKYTKTEQDLMILALLIHDGWKLGIEKSKYTKSDHPLLSARFVEEHKDQIELTEEERTLLCSTIASHMGPWNKDFDGNEILPVPKSKCEKFVHLCDYLASRKCLLVPFDEHNNITV